MKKIALLVLLTAIVFLVSPLAQEDESGEKTVEQKIDSLMTLYDEASGDSAKLAVVLDVLKKFPESEYTVPLLNLVKYHSSELNQMEKYVGFAEDVKSKIKTPEVRVEAARFMVGLYSELGLSDKLDAIAAELEAVEEKNFNLLYDLIEAYADVGKWRKVLSYAEDAGAFANAEAYKKEFPSTKLTEEELENRGRNRRGMLLSYSGWAKANLGRTREAIKDYEAADKLMQRTYMGFSDRELDYFWGHTLAKSGRFEEALDRLARKALFGEDEDSKSAMREAYVKLKGSDAGYDEYLMKRRMELGRKIDDFSLEGYDGEKLVLSSFKGKVVLLSFWFPT